MKKKKRSNGKGPSTFSSSKSSSLSTSTWLFLLFAVFILFFLATFYILNSDNKKSTAPSQKVQNSISLDSGGSASASTSHSAYVDVLRQAQELAQQYKNLTGFHPPGLESVLREAKTVLMDKAHDSQHLLQSLHSLLPSAASDSTSTSTTPTSSLSATSPAAASSSSPFLRGSRSAPTQTLSGTTKKDIIVGMAHNIDPKNFVVFCASFRANAPEAEAVIFINSPPQARNMDIAEEYKIHLVEYDVSKLDEEIRSYHPSTLRWPLMYKFFSDPDIRSRYGRVWMADVRDTYFQRNPFDMLPVGEKAFYAFHGVETMTISQCGWNGGWVKDCLGDEVLRQVGSQKIICSGVSVGDMDTVYDYLHAMDDVIMHKGETDLGKRSKFPQCERNGVDQGVHNALMHEGSMPHIKFFSQSSSPVMNLQAKKAVLTDNEIFNSQGERAAVVHQYDREPSYQQYLFAKYVDWVDTSDPLAEWKQEPACEAFQYKQDADMLKGRCDLKMKGGATGPASCCTACAETSGCQAFTFFGGACFLKGCSGPRSDHELTGALTGWRESRRPFWE